MEDRQFAGKKQTRGGGERQEVDREGMQQRWGKTGRGQEKGRHAAATGEDRQTTGKRQTCGSGGKTGRRQVKDRQQQWKVGRRSQVKGRLVAIVEDRQSVANERQAGGNSGRLACGIKYKAGRL